jgi:hypothetical protein
VSYTIRTLSEIDRACLAVPPDPTRPSALHFLKKWADARASTREPFSRYRSAIRHGDTALALTNMFRCFHSPKDRNDP